MEESLPGAGQEDSATNEGGGSFYRELSELIDAAKAGFLYLSEKGITGLSCSRESQKIIETWGRGVAVPLRKPLPSSPCSVSREEWETLSEEIRNCSACALGRNTTAKPKETGPKNARLVFIVPFPQTGAAHPFSGPAGELFLKIIQAMHLASEEIYVLNVVKCCPERELSPFSAEAALCASFLKRQLAIIQPEAVCVMGAFAVQSFLSTEETLEALRGRFHAYQGMAVMATHHPETLLKEPSKKREVWEDVKKIMDKLGLK